MHFGQPLPRRRGRLLDVWLDLGTRVKRRSSGCRHCGRLRRDCRGEHRRRHDGRFRRIELDLVRPFLRGVDAGDRPLGCRLRGAIPGLHRRRARPHPIRHEEQRDQHAPDVHKIPSDGHHVYVPLHSRQCDHETNARGCICSKRSQHATCTRFLHQICGWLDRLPSQTRQSDPSKDLLAGPMFQIGTTVGLPRLPRRQPALCRRSPS
jgi:hypothetical protein